MNILKLFKKPQIPKTMFDFSQSIPKDIVVKAFRGIASKNNISPTVNISDEEIINIYQK